MPNLINFHSIIRKKISTYHYKNKDTLTISKTRVNEPMTSNGDVYLANPEMITNMA